MPSFCFRSFKRSFEFPRVPPAISRTLAIPPSLSAPSDIGTRLIGLVVTVGGGCFCFSQNRRYLFVGQRLEVSRHLERLLQDFHRVAPRNAHAQREVHAISQTLDGRY